MRRRVPRLTMSLLMAIIFFVIGYVVPRTPGIDSIPIPGIEVRDAIRKLLEQSEIRGFILDLRGNSGGLLDAAVDVAGIFLPENTHIVSTIGFREGKHVFKTKDTPVLLNTPLAILINSGSASASEIVAGCFQDLDRAIIIGTDSFGKGLVQKIYHIDSQNTIYPLYHKFLLLVKLIFWY